MSYIHKHILQLKPSATLRINELSKQLVEQKKQVFRLGFGQSPFPVPPAVEQALKDAAAEKYSVLVIADEIHGKVHLTETGVALLPGVVFGRPPGELTARLAYVDFDGKRALAHIQSTNHHTTFIKSYCPNIQLALDVLQEWLTSLRG